MLADRTGQLLRNYRVLRSLGTSSFAHVYLAQHVDLKTQVVLKVFQTSLSHYEQRLFVSEARAIAQLAHPNIVPLLDYDREHHVCFLVMAYVPDETLRQRYPLGSSLSVSHVVSFVKQLASALSYAHTRNVLHQNIRPENMFSERDGKVVLTDFALPVFFSRAAVQQKAISYTAPEQLQGEASPASDQYALASVVYEWLTGQNLVMPEMMMKQRTSLPVSVWEKLSTHSPLVADVVQTALKSDPQQRFRSVAAFANALEQAHAESQGRAIIPVLPDAVATSHVLPVRAIPLEHSQRSVSSVPQTPSTPRVFASSSPAKSTEQGRREQRVRIIPVLLGIVLALVLVLAALVGGLFLVTGIGNTRTNNVGTRHQGQATSLSPTPTFMPTPTFTPLPTATPTHVEGVVYQANWSQGWSGKGSSDWQVANQELVNDGSSYSQLADPTIVAPYTVSGTSDYAVETRVHVIAGWPCFDIALRGTSTPDGWHGYKAAVCDEKIRLQAGNDILTTVPFNPGTIWHSYRFEVKGSHLAFFVDGIPLAQANDMRYPSGGQVGLKSYGTQLEINSLKVTAF